MPTHRAATASPGLRAGATAATLAVGAPLLRAALLAPRGGDAFRHRAAALAATWASGGAATGALQAQRWQVLDRDQARDRVARPVVTAAAAVAVFAAGASVLARVPALRGEIETVIAHATRGAYGPAAALALLTGASEELFFRGTVHDLAASLGLPRVPTTTAVYAVTTCATGNPVLVLAAGLLGALAGQERVRTDSLLAPTLLHVGWSVGMLATLPHITRRARERAARRPTRSRQRRGVR